MKEDTYDYLEELGYTEFYPRENVRILFKTNGNVIEDLTVEEWSNLDQKQHLYATYTKDIGNCMADWNDWTLSDVMMRIFVCYHVPEDLKQKVLCELSRVQEWRPQIAVWIRKYYY